MTHFPRLDGLRGLAVLMVFVNHFLPLPGAHHFGWLGVDLFFVLSGFLITGILLRDRDAALSRSGALWRFVARRSLRIFPAYLLVVGLAIGLGEPRAVEAAPWLLTYTYNFALPHLGLHAPVSHLWSLCVEEQFYLVWPLVVLFCPRALFLPLALALVALAPAWRFYALFALGDGYLASYHLPGACDCLAAGALGAWVLSRLGPAAADRLARACLGLGAVGLAGWYVVANWHKVVWLVRPSAPGQPAVQLEFVIGNTVAAAFFLGAVLRSTRPSLSPGDVLLWGPLRYVGRISYGLYLYHMFVVAIWVKFHALVHPLQPSAMYPCLALSFLVAAASYHLFEKPILSLKRYLEPRRAEPAAPEPLRLAA